MRRKSESVNLTVLQMNESAFNIKYGAFNGSDGIEDLNEIQEFKDAMSASYITLVKPLIQGRGGGAYQLVIDWLSEHSLKDYLEIIGGFLAGKVIDRISDPIVDKYLFNPFKKAYRKLREKNPDQVGISSFHMDFADTAVLIYSFNPDSIFDNFDFILSKLFSLRQLLEKDPQLPWAISIPVIEDEPGVSYRLPEEKDELTFHQTKRNFYTRYWELTYLPHGKGLYMIYKVGY